MKKEIEAFVNAANEQELEAAWNNLSAEEQRIFEQLMEEDSPEDATLQMISPEPDRYPYRWQHP